MNIQSLLNFAPATSILDECMLGDMATQLGTLTNTQVYPRSITPADGSVYFLARTAQGKHLALLANSPSGLNLPVAPQWSELLLDGKSVHLALLAMDTPTAAWLRKQ